MIPTLCKILCLFVPGKRNRKRKRSQLTKLLTDAEVDKGKVYYLTSPCREEYTIPDTLIRPGMRVLCVAPHPDDETLGVGGILSKYPDQCDVLCVCSSGYKRKDDTQNSEEIAEERIKEFQAALDTIGITNRWIVKIHGKLPHLSKMEAQMDTYRTIVDWKSYDLILIPDPFDGHREHQYVSCHLIPKLLKEQGCKPNALVGYYPIWGTVTCPNYFERITDVHDTKTAALKCYKSRMRERDHMGLRVEALNYFYGFLADYKTKYAEALRVEPVCNLLEEPDRRDWARFF